MGVVMIVYRLEGRTGTGPYTDLECRDVLSEHSFGWRSKHHPSPSSDIDRDNHDKIKGGEPYFACNSITQLLSWWHSEKVNAELERVGANVAIYSVPDQYVAVGNKQVAFLRTKARKIGTATIREATDAMFYM